MCSSHIISSNSEIPCLARISALRWAFRPDREFLRIQGRPAVLGAALRHSAASGGREAVWHKAILVPHGAFMKTQRNRLRIFGGGFAVEAHWPGCGAGPSPLFSVGPAPFRPATGKPGPRFHHYYCPSSAYGSCL